MTFYEHSFNIFLDVIKREIDDIQNKELPALGGFTSFFGEFMLEQTTSNEDMLFREEVSCQELLEEQFDRGK